MIGTGPEHDRWGWAGVLCLSWATGVACAEEVREDATYSVGEVGQRIVESVEQAEAGRFSGAVLVAADGKVVAAVAAGYADLAGEQRNTPATLFEIASCTKQFTAAAVMRLVQDQRLTLNDSIAMHLPTVPEDCKAITIEHLLRHTSGIPGTNSEGWGDDVEQVLPRFLRGGPVYAPGTHWEYWNQGYALASEVIKRASGQEYVDYCRQMLFEPAGMRATRFTGDDPPPESLVAVGRSARGPPRSALEHPYGSYGFQYRGMGGVVSTVWDMWRWDRALDGEEVLREPAKAAMFAPGLRDYALGWFVTTRRGRLVQSHSGGVRGFACEVRRYPDEDAFVIVLANRDDAPVRSVAQSLEDIILGEALASLPPELAKALAGVFKDDRGNSLEIEPAGAVTRARIRWTRPVGAVTTAVLGINASGQIILNDGNDLIVVAVVREGEGPAQRLTIMDRIYQRSE